MMETAAREMGKDPAELRRQNFVKEFPHQTPVIMNYDSGDFEGGCDGSDDGGGDGEASDG